MADDSGSFTKDTVIIKPPKSPLLLRMVVLIFAMVCGVYICFICLKQIGVHSSGQFLNVHVIERPCETTDIEPSEKLYVHFPKPKTFSRSECACNPVSASKNECTAAVGLKWMLNQGLMQNHEEIVEYFKTRGVSAIFLFRRNLLRRMISILANSYDQNAKLLNGTHKSHTHSPREAKILASYKPTIDTKLLIPNLKQVQDMAAKALEYFSSTRHIILYYEDILKNQTILNDVLDFLKVPRRELHSRQVKIHKGPLSSQVSNWVDVEKTLTGTPYESFVQADYRR